MKLSAYIMLGLMLLTVGCKQLTVKEFVEKQGHEMMARVEKDADRRIESFLKDTLSLTYPESYEPLSTDLSIVTNYMLIYDTKAFVALRDLSYALESFHEEHGDNDSITQEIQDELNVMRSMADVVCDRIHEIIKRPLKLRAIAAYHQFNVNDNDNQKVRKGYHFIFYKNNKITLLCNNDDFLRVEEFIKQLSEYPNQYVKGAPIEGMLLSPLSNAMRVMERASTLFGATEQAP